MQPARVLLADRHGLSRELQIGKAAEHLVCAELILLGHSAFLADAGLPYDVIVDVNGKVLRVQVKSTMKAYRYARKDGRTSDSYRFGLRRGKSFTRMALGSVDVVAFVALDVRRIAYLRLCDLVGKSGKVAGLVEFVDDAVTRRWAARAFGKCAAFPPAAPKKGVKKCFTCGKEMPATTAYFKAEPRNKLGIIGICIPCLRKANTEAARKRRERRAS